MSQSKGWSPTVKELSIVVFSAFAVTLLMSFLDAYERLYLFTQMYELVKFDEFAVFMPSFLAMGFLIFSYRQIQELEHEIGRRKEVEQALLESEDRYRHQSITDDLTQLYNARHFYVEMDREIERTNRYSSKLSLLLLDIDRFKHYNDTYGHLEGNKVLSKLGKVIQALLRRSDSAFRYGGEEFMVVLPETDGEEALIVAERIRKAFEAEEFLPVPDEVVHNTMSIGVSQYKPAEDSTAFLKRVDAAMYEAKSEGRNRIQLV